ncbi:MAG TPA: endolytic transglycosylase MltG [Treponemataceae bacterium]|nr:endolytic transglycosylase MltG [Treponemataceae bacterium]
MKTRKSRKNIAFAIIALALIVSAAVAAILPGMPVSSAESAVLFRVPEGSSVLEIADSLEGARLIRSALYARLYVRFSRDTLKAGYYRVSPSMSTWAIVQRIAEGKQDSVRVTIPEGLTISKVAEHLERAGVLSARDFIAAAEKPNVLASRGIASKTAEGFLFPDTYFFPVGVDANAAVAMMVDNFFAKIKDVPNAPKSGSELYAKVILASIVEREYRAADEAPIIASVFENRIKIGMGLQSCATIEYIITEIQKKPHPARLMDVDLEIESDYNTYKWAGLPPGPISNPGLVALNAAINPENTKYLYFRLTDPEAGRHSFTHSLDEHVRAGRQLVLKKAAGN